MKWAFFAPTVLCDTHLYPDNEWGMAQSYFLCITCGLHYFCSYRCEDRRCLGNKNK